MKWTTLLLFLSAVLWLSGCGGGGGSPPPMASAGPAAPPPPGDLPPPTTPSGEGGAPPPESTPPDGGAPPAGEQAPTTGTSEGGSAAGDGYQPPPQTPGEGSPLAGTPGDPGDGTGQPAIPRPPRIKSWREQAEDALVAGNEQEWFRLIHTNFLINPGSWKDLDQQMAWVAALRRPALGTRFGVAALYTTVPRDFDGSPQPIGSTELKTAMSNLQQNAGGGGSGGGAIRRTFLAKKGEGGGAPTEGGGESSSPGETRRGEPTELTHHAGDFGTKFLDALKSRVESGAYGPIYKEMAEVTARGRQRRPAADPNNPSDGGEGIPSPNTDTPGSVAPGSSGDGGRAGEGVEQRPAPRSEGGSRLGTSVVWLGKVSNKEELASLAQKAGVDIVVIYELAIKTSRLSELVNNVTKLRIVTASSLKKDSK